MKYKSLCDSCKKGDTCPRSDKVISNEFARTTKCAFGYEKKVQTPSCLTNPERRDELLERYKEGGEP